MPQGKHNNHRGRGGGRARGHGPTRGQGRGRGRGRGGIPTATAAAAVVGHANNGRWSGPPRAGSGMGAPLRGVDSPRRGDATPSSWGGRGRGRGGGRGQTASAARDRPQLGTGPIRAGALGKDAPLSDLLYAERPLLRPITFVRATLTPFLFQDSEEMLKPVDTIATSDVPTATRIAQVFHDNVSDSGSESEAFPEIEIASESNHEPLPDAIIVGEQRLPSSNTSLDVLMHALSLSTASEPHPASVETSNAPPHAPLPQTINYAPAHAQTAPAQKAERATALGPLSVPPSGRTSKATTAKAPIRALAAHTPDDDALETLVRRFVADRRHSVVLPAMDKPTRTRLHAFAAACGVRSVGKGKGKGRQTTLFRTAGTTVHEGRLRGVRARDKKDNNKGKGKGKDGKGMPSQREGDEIGKEAPKIGSSNIGFQMLASMGWTEGDRIGGSASVGIKAPLTAIIKRSKLGLGATRA